jgi:hypothetical protein
VNKVQSEDKALLPYMVRTICLTPLPRSFMHHEHSPSESEWV